MRYGLRDWDESVAALGAAGEVVAVCHFNPDGDALGSLLGMGLALDKLGKKVWATWGDKQVALPPSYRFLPGGELLVGPADVPASKLLLALDCGAADRLGDLEHLIGESPTVINVDHHKNNDGFGTHNLVVDTASSTAEIVTGLIEDLGAALDSDIATCLYAGVVTDTGRFQYSNSTPDTLRLSADLLALGVDAPAIAVEVFESAPFAYLKLLGRVLERATLLPAERFVYSWLMQEDLAAAGVGAEEADKLIDSIRSTRDADVAAMFKQQADGQYRVSLRSKGPVNVGALARERGGGGHDLAAGFTAPSLDEAIEDLRSTLASSPPTIEAPS